MQPLRNMLQRTNHDLLPKKRLYSKIKVISDSTFRGARRRKKGRANSHLLSCFVAALIFLVGERSNGGIHNNFFVSSSATKAAFTTTQLQQRQRQVYMPLSSSSLSPSPILSSLQRGTNFINEKKWYNQIESISSSNTPMNFPKRTQLLMMRRQQQQQQQKKKKQSTKATRIITNVFQSSLQIIKQRWMKQRKVSRGSYNSVIDTTTSAYSSRALQNGGHYPHQSHHNLFENTIYNTRRRRINSLTRYPLSTLSAFSSSPSSASSTQLQMVLTIPEAIIEQASTQSLLDDLIDESVRTKSRKPIMRQFDPSSGWIWRRWRGTIFSETWKTCVKNMFIATIVTIVFHNCAPFREAVKGFNILWGQLLSVTTFTLTFFLNVSYALWRKCQELSRRLQGRLNDLGMTLAAHAERTTPANPDDPSVYTPAARQFLELIARYVRVFNLLTYASFTRSHRPVLTPRGMRRLVERGVLTSQEMQILVDTELPPTMRHNALILWIIRLFVEGMRAGHVVGGDGFEQQFMEKIHVIRAQYGAIGDELQGRMPLAYAHIVQVLVDVILWMYPFQALSSGMPSVLGVVGCGLLTMCYQGLFDLAKQFLDPYDNENYGKGEDPLCVDTLIAETNAGSVRWMHGLEKQPFSSQRLRDGELFNSLLPVRGYSVEELQERKEREEAEKQKREQERLEREEVERKLKDIEEREKEKEEGKLKEIEKQRQKEEEEDSEIARSKEEEAREKGEEGSNKLSEVDDTVVVDSNLTENFDGISGMNATYKKTVTEIRDVEEVNGNFVNQEEDEEGYEEEAKVHKVFSLKGGIPVTLDENPDDEIISNITNGDNDEIVGLGNVTIENETAKNILEEEEKTEDVMIAQDNDETIDNLINDDITINTEEVKPVKINSDTAPINGGMSMSISDKEKTIQSAKKEPLNDDKEKGTVDDDLYKMVDFDMYTDLLLLDDVGPDGQEYRLSQILADEDWEEDSVYDEEEFDIPLTYEDYTQKAADIIEAAEDELLETAEILQASPGAEATMDVRPKDGSASSTPTLDSPPKKRVADKPIKKKPESQPAYDQTRLDGVSQLWGAAPEVLDLYRPDEPPPLQLNDTMFNGISQLWGEAPMLSGEDLSDSYKSIGFDSISQMWGEPHGSPYSEEGKGQDSKSASKRDPSAYDELDWFEEVGPDGKEYRLSQMLADEEDWEEEPEPVASSPMSLEDYSKQAAELIEAASDELLETEAILNAPLGAETNYADDDDEEEKAAPAGSETSAVAEAVMAAAEKARLATEKEMIADIDETLAVLEMDEVEQNDESSIAEELSEGGGTLDTSNEENTAGSEMKGNEHESDVGMQFENEGSIKGKDVK